MSMAFRFGTQTLMGRGPPNVSSSMPSRFFRPTVAASPCPHYSMITRSSAAGGAFSRRQHRDFSQFLRNREKSWCCRRENLHLSITSATAVAHRPPTQLVVFRCTDAALQQTRRSVLTPFSTQTLHQVLYFSTSDPCRSPSEGGQSSPGKYTGARRDERKKSYDPRDPENQSFWQRTLGVGAAGYAAFKILPGLKIAVPLLKLTKAGPLASLLLSSLAYTAVFGWQYGLGMISLIFVHETGHALMMKYLRVPTGPMTFIPFMGAAVEMRGYPKNAAHEAAIGIAGPILGSLGAVVPFAYGLATGSQLAFALAHWGFLINLFNLMPIGDMDGGRITSGLSPWFLVAGLGGNACLLYAMPHHPILYLTMLGGCYSGKGSSSTYSRFFSEDHRPPGYYNLSGTQKAAIAGSYFGLITTLIVAMQVNDQFRKSPQRLREEQELQRRKQQYSGGGFGSSTVVTEGETVWSYGVGDWALENMEHVERNFC